MNTRRLCTALAFVLLGGCTFKASCGGGGLNMKKAKEFLSGVVKDESGVAPTKVDCPSEVKVEKGKTFDCTVEVAGVSGVFTLLMEDDEGYVTVQSAHGLLLTNKLEKTITQGIEQQGGIKATVACGPRVHAAVPGATFECTATDPQGKVMKIGITVKDDTGNVSWKLIGPAPAPAPAAAPPSPAPTPQ